jgi:GNAT superfamily N-acetyltransferase
MSALTKQRPSVRYRPMALSDIAICLGLLAQLGYELERREAERRSLAITGLPGHSLLVAAAGEQIVGLLHIYARPALEKPPEAVVQAVVVDRSFRGGGIGKAFMAAAERWAAERGYHSVSLSSNVVRAEAHAFYEAIGYRRFASSHLFRKELPPR